jgi:hypothetical protein
MGHQIAGIEYGFIPFDRQDRGRHNLFNCWHEGIDVSRDHAPNHIGIRQDTDDILSVRHKQAVDVAIPHKPGRRLHIGISRNRNKLFTRNHERFDWVHATSSLADSVHHPPACRVFRLIRAENRVVAIDWGKRIVEIIGSLSKLICASLLQNRRCIHHFEDGVGAGRQVENGDAISFRRSDD